MIGGCSKFFEPSPTPRKPAIPETPALVTSQHPSIDSDFLEVISENFRETGHLEKPSLPVLGFAGRFIEALGVAERDLRALALDDFRRGQDLRPRNLAAAVARNRLGGTPVHRRNARVNVA